MHNSESTWSFLSAQWCPAHTNGAGKRAQAGGECLARLSLKLVKLPNLHLGSCHHPSCTITTWTSLEASFTQRTKSLVLFHKCWPRQQREGGTDILIYLVSKLFLEDVSFLFRTLVQALFSFTDSGMEGHHTHLPPSSGSSQPQVTHTLCLMKAKLITGCLGTDKNEALHL